MLAQLLQTKLNIPPLNPNQVSRSALVGRLDDGLRLNHRLFLISAPAGFGKTTLLNEWFSRLPESSPGSRIAWLSLDKEDNTPVRFWTYVIAALQSAYPEIGLASQRYLRTSHDLSSALVAMSSSSEGGGGEAEWNEFVLTPLLNELIGLSGPIILVLDDYHVISGQVIHEGLGFLLDHLPPQLHLVIASRVDPPLPVGRLRARGQLTELRAADLRFTLPEVKALLDKITGLELNEADLSALAARTEGWAAGLQMASIAIRANFDRNTEQEADKHQQNVSKIIASLTGKHQYIIDYLVEEVFQRQSEAVQQFLLKTSILGKMCAPLCEALIIYPENSISGKVESAALLEYLQKANLFIIPLDAERRWYRYHHLFADLLQSRLRLIHPQWINDLHQRASKWFEKNDDIEGALSHALAAQDWERAAGLLEKHALAFLNRGELVRVLDWIKLLPKDVAFRRPRLCIAQAWANAFANQLGEVKALLQAAEEAISQGKANLTERPEDGFQDVKASIAIIQVYLAITSGDPDRAVALAQNASDLVIEENPQDLSFLYWMKGYAVRMLGEVEQATTSFKESIRIGKMNHELWTVMLALTDLALACKLQGKLQQAASYYHEAIRYAAEFGVANHGYLSRVDAALAEILREQNHLDEALQYARSGVEKTRYWQSSNHIAWAHTYLARVLQGRGDLDGAAAELQLGDEARRRSPVLRGVNSLVDTSQVSLWLATGDWAAARRWANGIQAEINGNPAILQPRSEFDETRLIALVRIMYTDAFREAPMMAEKTALTIMDQALDLLAHLESAARRGSRTGSLIEILALKALVFYQRFSISKPGDSKSELPAEVGAALDECLALAEPEGYIRTFIDEGESMRHLLVAYGRKPLQLTRKSYIARLLAAFPGASTTGSLATRPGLIEPLSEREQEVLAMIAAGLSSQDIAHKLIVAPGTIKAHIATIYRKLDVHSRTQALAVAKALHLLNE